MINDDFNFADSFVLSYLMIHMFLVDIFKCCYLIVYKIKFI